MFGQTSSQLGQHCWQQEWCHRRRWPWKTGLGHLSQTCRPNSGPSFDSLHATLRWSPWFWRPSHLQLHLRCKWAPSWRTGDHWCWIWCLLSSHTSPCHTQSFNCIIRIMVRSFNQAEIWFSIPILSKPVFLPQSPTIFERGDCDHALAWLDPVVGTSNSTYSSDHWIDSSSIASSG